MFVKLVELPVYEPVTEYLKRSVLTGNTYVCTIRSVY